jgi:hypothetical protein
MEFVICVKHEQKIGFIECVFQCESAIVCKVDPFITVQFAFNVFLRKEFADYLSGGVRGPRVANHPVVKSYLGTQHFQSATNDVRLILDNHVQT